MKVSKAAQYKNDWEYEQAKQEERKNERAKRDVRRNRKSRWTPKGEEE